MLSFCTKFSFNKIIEIKGVTRTSFTKAMSEALAKNKEQLEKNAKKKKEFYKSRYDGRSKKRQWEDYSADSSNKRPADFNPLDRIKKKKFCLLLGYSGHLYYGMQRNPDMKTIEEDLLVAMLKNKWINEEGFNQAQTIQFQRAARTDKGVSAARQCVSLKLPDDIDINDLNKDLPPQIRLFSATRVTKGFNSKEKCCARTYTYTIPTVAFASYDEQVEMETYRVPSEKIDILRELLKMFEGTKSFHNFTSRKEFIDPSSKRYIITFDCEQPLVRDNVEFVTLKVKGQSFMLHQIRKMVGLTVAVARGLTLPETITRSFTETRLDIPMAPGLGLVLDTVHYDRYNTKYDSDGIHELLTWEKEEPQVVEFFNNFIMPTIIETEIKEKPMVAWLETLPIHSYEERTNVSKSTKEDPEEDDEEEEEAATQSQSSSS